MSEENQSGMNTVLIVILLLIVVGFGVWLFTTNQVGEPSGANIEVQLPAGDGGSQ